MKETLRLIVVLTLFCIVASGLLAWTYAATKSPIEQALRAELIDALKRVLPECDNDVVADAKVINENGQDRTFYVGRRDGAFAGTAFRSVADGYGGPIEVLVGVLPDGALKSIEILQAEKETPGLGAKIKDRDFRDRFAKRPASDTSWAAVKKDGGDIQAITGATISSRGVTRAVKAGLDVYARHAEEIR